MATRLISGIATISQYERTDSGALRVRAIARTPGILTYFDSNGPRRELVTSEFLRSTDPNGFPLAGKLADIPVTLEHPPSLLHNDAAKIQQYGVGKTSPKVKVYTDGRIQVDMEISEPAAIAAVESGEKRGVSLGYVCDINRKDGIYNGVRYDAEQCAPFEADHLAIVANPRAKEALIQSFERADSNDDIAVALFEEFTPVGVNVVDSPRSDSTMPETAATVAISDLVPDTYQIEINGKPHRVDAKTYADIQAERADAKKKAEAMNKEFMAEDDEDEDSEDEDEREDMAYQKKDAAEQIQTILARCDADSLSDALYNLDVLTGRFDGAETVADVVDALEAIQGRLDALRHTDSEHYDSDEVAELLSRLDAESPAEAILKLDGQQFIEQHRDLLPPDFNLDGQTLSELQLAAINYVRPGLELHSDSEQSIAGAFSVIAAEHKRSDSSSQLDRAFRADMINANPGVGVNQATGTPIMQPISDSLWSLSKAVRKSGSK